MVACPGSLAKFSLLSCPEELGKILGFLFLVYEKQQYPAALINLTVQYLVLLSYKFIFSNGDSDGG